MTEAPTRERRDRFETADGRAVPAVTAATMREVDRVAVEEVGLPLLSMMENAGRALARVVRAERGGRRVVVLAGGGGNGGGGLACARHLANRDVPVEVVLDRDPAALAGATATQWRIVLAMEPEPKTAATFAFFHLVYGLVLAGVLAAGLF